MHLTKHVFLLLEQAITSKAGKAAHTLHTTYRMLSTTNSRSGPTAIKRLLQILLQGHHPHFRWTRAIERLGKQIEQHPPLPYHGPHHLREVMLSAAVLLLRSRIAPAHSTYRQHRHAAALLYAAASHDLGHDGGTNFVMEEGRFHHVPFRLEREAAKLATLSLQLAGLQQEISFVASIIFATDVSGPHRLARSAAKGVAPPALLAEELKHLFQSKSAARTALILLDSDILTSAGLTSGSTVRQTTLVGIEAGRPVSRAETLGFFDHVALGAFASDSGQSFTPRLRSLRRKSAAPTEGDAECAHAHTSPNRSPQ